MAASASAQSSGERLELARLWLREILGTDIDGIEPASTDASFRRYFRVQSHGASYILMDAPPDKEDCDAYVRVCELLRRAGVNVPEVHARDAGRGFLLIGDLGTRSYLDLLRRGDAARLYADAIEALLRMQTRIEPIAVPLYDETRVRAELALFSDWFLGRHLDIELTSRQAHTLEAAYALLCGHFLAQPRVFVHRDYHSRNLMVCDDRNPGVLDFQDAVAGPAAYDVASLFRDVYIAWPEWLVEKWMGEYHERALQSGVAVSANADTFLRDVDLIGAQRHLKVAGIFCRLYYRDAKPAYLDDIPLTLDYLLAECARQAELAPLHALLTELGVVERLARTNASPRGGEERR